MEPKVAVAIRTLLKGYDRWPEGTFVQKKSIALAITVLRMALKQVEKGETEVYASTYDVNTLDHWTHYLRWAAYQPEGLPGLVRVWNACRDSDYYRTISAEAALYLRGYYDGLHDYLTF